MVAREKLLLFVLADYHNEERNCAWAGLTSISKAALTSRRHIVTLLDDLERKGTLIIQRRTHETNLYWFVGLPSEATSLPRELPAPGSEVRLHQGSEVATAPQPPLNLHKQPTKDFRECEFTPTQPAIKEILRIYEQERGSLPGVRDMNAQRLSKCRQRVLNHAADQQKFLADFLAAVRKAGKFTWPAWRPSFDWFVSNDTNYQKVLEGNYDHWAGKEAGNAEARKQAITTARQRLNLVGTGETPDPSRKSA